MATRQKTKVISNVSRQMAEEAFATYNTEVSALQIIEGNMNGEITKIKERFEAQINEHQKERDTAFETLQVYATENGDLFEKKKSVEWTHGTFGFRTGTPKLKPRKGFTWESIKILAKGLFPKYIRTVEEVNKELILADREKLADSLKDLGVEVVQDETFYVQPKLQELAQA